jgi:hypothetical protein
MTVQLRVVNQLICDYTDGRFRLEKVEFVNHPAEKKNADFFWYSRSDRARAPVGTFGQPGVHFTIYNMERGDTIAHELGHMVFGLSDEYPEARQLDTPFWRAGVTSGSMTIAEPVTMRRFFQPAYGGLSFKDLLLPGDVPISAVPPMPGTPPTPLYANKPGDTWWVVNNSIMQQAGGSYCPMKIKQVGSTTLGVGDARAAAYSAPLKAQTVRYRGSIVRPVLA